MDLLKKLVLAFFMSFAMLVIAPTAMAAPAGKVANQTQAEVVQSLIDTVNVSEETLAAMKSGADKDAVMALLKKTKQTAKRIESAVVLSDRDRALARVNKARSAYKKGDTAEAEELMAEAVERFKDVEKKFHNF